MTEELTESRPERKRIFQEILDLLTPGRHYFYTPILVYINVLVFIVMVVSGVHPLAPTVQSMLQWGGNLRTVTFDGQQWRLLTNIFIHAGIIHLLFNMYALIFVGGLLERRMGRHKFLVTYLVTGVMASLASVSFNEGNVSIGASGAIFGMYGLFLALLVTGRIAIPGESKQNLINSVLFFMGYNLIYGFTRSGVDNTAHIGGLLSGMTLGFLYYPLWKKPGYSEAFSIGVAGFVVMLVVTFSVLLPDNIRQFQYVMRRFVINEEEATWMYREDLSYIPADRIQYYYDRFRDEGIDVWEENLQLLASLHDLPDYLQKRVVLLTEYCRLRKQSCELMQYMIRYNSDMAGERLQALSKKIDAKVKEIQALTQ